MFLRYSYIPNLFMTNNGRNRRLNIRSCRGSEFWVNFGCKQASLNSRYRICGWSFGRTWYDTYWQYLPSEFYTHMDTFHWIRHHNHYDKSLNFRYEFGSFAYACEGIYIYMVWIIIYLLWTTSKWFIYWKLHITLTIIIVHRQINISFKTHAAN